MTDSPCFQSNILLSTRDIIIHILPVTISDYCEILLTYSFLIYQIFLSVSQRFCVHCPTKLLHTHNTRRKKIFRRKEIGCTLLVQTVALENRLGFHYRGS